MPRTETGLARYHDGEEVTASDIDAIEDQAAAMERERLRKKTVDTDNDHAAWCENPAGEAATGMLCHRCKGILRYLLADPTP